MSDILAPSSTLIYIFIRTGLITKATNNDEPSVMIKVMGKNFMNSPIIPGQKARGKKAANVVAVEEIIGIATSPTPFIVASIGDNPSSISLYTFSTTTIPLSTSIPSAMIKANNTIMLMVIPSMPRMRNDINIESGIAIPTNIAFLVPRKNNSTRTTRITPKMILFSRFETISFVCLLWSLVTTISRSAGNTSFFALSSNSPIFSVAIIKFSPLLLITSTITTGLL